MCTIGVGVGRGVGVKVLVGVAVGVCVGVGVAVALGVRVTVDVGVKVYVDALDTRVGVVSTVGMDRSRASSPCRPPRGRTDWYARLPTIVPATIRMPARPQTHTLKDSTREPGVLGRSGTSCPTATAPALAGPGDADLLFPSWWAAP